MTNREWAIHYVRERLEAGYTVEMAEQEAGYGYGNPTEPGFDIQRGFITVDWFSPEPFRARFADLAREIQNPAQQVSLFEVAG